MKISNIQIVPIRPNDGLVAFASVTLEIGLYLGSIGVHKRLDGTGYRITYPTKKVGSSEMPIYNPTTPNVSKLIEIAVSVKAEELFG